MERIDTSASDESNHQDSPRHSVGKLPSTCRVGKTAFLKHRKAQDRETRRVDTSSETDDTEQTCRPNPKATQGKKTVCAPRKKKKGCHF